MKESRWTWTTNLPKHECLSALPLSLWIHVQKRCIKTLVNNLFMLDRDEISKTTAKQIKYLLLTSIEKGISSEEKRIYTTRYQKPETMTSSLCAE